MEELIKALEQLNHDIDFRNEKSLIDDKVIDSLEMIKIVTLLHQKYGVRIPASKVKPCNFNSVEAMWNMLQEILDEE